MTKPDTSPEAVERLIFGLRSYQQADEEGVMCLASRQACEEGADMLTALSAELETARNPKAKPRVKVKPLVWEQSGFCQDADFVDTTRTYQIQEGIFWYGCESDGTKCGSNKAAKAAAQAHHEAAVLAMIEGEE